MNTERLRVWAAANGSALESGTALPVSVTSKLIRFQWKGSPAVAVGGESETKTRIDSVLDGLAWSLHRNPREKSLHIIVGSDESGLNAPIRKEFEAMGTIITALQGNGPQVHLWRLADDGSAQEIEAKPAVFTSGRPKLWLKMLLEAAKPPEGLAGMLIEAIGHPSLALYPKLSSVGDDELWQIRIDGFDIGRVGTKTGTLEGPKSSSPGTPRKEWREILGTEAHRFNVDSLATTAKAVRQLIEAFSSGIASGNVLAHRQAEHGLEAHILSGRLRLNSSAGELRLAVPNTDGVLRGAQFPTLWADNHEPHYLDALLADSLGRPWAIELKDQDAGGGSASYLRAGIGQAVLYRHYIRTADEISPWFQQFHGLDNRQCEAALAFPTASRSARTHIQRHIDLASRFGVHVIEFDRPGYVS